MTRAHPDTYRPRYLELGAAELRRRAEQLNELLRSCRLCPRACGVDRTKGELGACRADAQLVVSSAMPHHGEEPVLSGRRGSGTIFFTHCNLRCVFCQNYQISQQGEGRPVSIEGLAGMMLSLQQHGCHNINLVTPTHYAPQIIAALAVAVEKGLSLPIVYNCGGYESIETLSLLDGIVDIYMPDAKYGDAERGLKYSGVKDYPQHNIAAIKEMYRQVGPLTVGEDGVARYGLMIRHLVLPNDLANTQLVLSAIRDAIGTRVFLSLMAQYHPCNRAHTFPELNRRITRSEYRSALDAMEQLGFSEGYAQSIGLLDDSYLPDFINNPHSFPGEKDRQARRR